MQSDVAVVAEFERVLRPGGTLVVNVPHIKPRSILRRLRPLLGISDARHGHVRPGYTRAGLRTVLGSRFRIEQEREYCGSFSESLDMVLNAALEQRTKGSARSAKGAVLTGSELAGLNKEYRLLSLAYPILKAWSALDVLLPFQSRYRLIVRARRPGLDLPSK